MEEFIFNKGEREVLNEVLDEQERTYIQHFVDDPRLFEAVRKTLLIPLYNWGTLKKGKKPRTDVNFVLSYINLKEEDLGKQMKAISHAMFFIEKGFQLLSTLKKQEVINKVEENEAI